MKKLDIFKLQIALNESQNALVSLWISRFLANSVHIWSTPELQGQILTIHPADFTQLLSFAEPGDCSELEFYRLRKLGVKAIESTLESESKTTQELRAMTLSALEGLAPESWVAVPFHELSLPDTM